MSIESLPIESVSYMELIAGRKDQNPPLLAKKLHKWRYIYVIYGALDGLSLSYSMIKYLFDLASESKQSASDEMHDWLMEPGGALAAASSSIVLIAFSMLANHFNDEDPNAFKRYIAILWPYCRDTMKGLKNAYKGVRSTLQVAELLNGQNLSHLFVPIGVLLGGLSVLNRIWYRRMLTERKSMMKENAKLLEEIQNSKDITLDNIDDYLEKIQRQTERQKQLGLLSATYGGIVDGLYLYVGVLGLCSLSPPALVAMSVFSFLYVAISIATRTYEEYDFQRKLFIAQAKIELAHSGKKIELMVEALQKVHSKVARDSKNCSLLAEQLKLIESFERAVELFEEKRENYRSVTTLSYTSAVLAGAKSGLYAYSALASIVFAVGTILVLASVPFPPALLITCISLGVVFLTAFIAHSVINTYRHHCKQEKEIEAERQIDKEKLSHIQWLYDTSKKDVEKLEPEQVKTAILDGMAIDPTPQFFFEEWFEVVRSFFSGVGKGTKAVSLMMNSLEVPDDKGHYHESLIMMGFIAVSAFIHTIAFGLRAYARMGRDPLEKPFITNKRRESTCESSLFLTDTGECSPNSDFMNCDSEQQLPSENQFHDLRGTETAHLPPVTKPALTPPHTSIISGPGGQIPQSYAMEPEQTPPSRIMESGPARIDDQLPRSSTTDSESPLQTLVTEDESLESRKPNSFVCIRSLYHFFVGANVPASTAQHPNRLSPQNVSEYGPHSTVVGLV
ncbi:hypothetical protein [Legionella micdadei]|uniref:Transmembrane protein n=1 Tax=Legionella micdadei TaxID=451 RepID=A0A098GJY9_LEGMI|nr:hypothetical protein [Legionella micdadei]KTD28921.1 transmembrane protein [Legionella micdadei]CEG62302.1 conserved membrane protein of unknown function [Legionella micdadei]SCY04298.1 hypothetical protein SAMN02982997_00692 [Legionella micdadei]